MLPSLPQRHAGAAEPREGRAMSIHSGWIGVAAVVMTLALAAVLVTASGRIPTQAMHSTADGPVSLAAFY
jgi:hypothetical protein